MAYFICISVHITCNHQHELCSKLHKCANLLKTIKAAEHQQPRKAFCNRAVDCEIALKASVKEIADLQGRKICPLNIHRKSKVNIPASLTQHISLSFEYIWPRPSTHSIKRFISGASHSAQAVKKFT